MKRGKIDLMADMVTATINKHKISHIMYKTNTGATNLYPLMKDAITKGIIRMEYDGQMKRYYVTEKGYLFLKCYKDLKVIVGNGKNIEEC